MKIIFKSLEEMTSHVKSLLKKYQGKGMTKAASCDLVKEYLDGNEFANEEGHVLKLSLEAATDEPANDDPDAIDGKALTTLIQKAVKDAIKDTATKSGSAPAAVDVKEDWERLLEDKKWGFKNLGEFGQAIFLAGHPNAAAKRVDSRLGLIQKANMAIRNKATPTMYASELVGADGGFMVPPEYLTEIWIAIHDKQSILSLCDVTPTSSNVVNWTVDENTPWDNSSGIAVNWRAQAATMSQIKPVLQNRQCQLNELYALLPATDELIADAPRLNNYLSQKAPEKIGWAVDDSIFRGTGQGQPLGFLNAPSLVTISTASTGATYTLLDLSNLYARLLEINSMTPTACWFMTKRALAALPQITIGGGLGFPIAVQNQNIGGRIQQMIFGLPVYQSMHCSAFGMQGDIVLADMKGMAVFNKAEGIDFQSSIHLFFDSGATAFRWRFRLGGEPYLRAVVTPKYDTTNTMSHFVTMPGR